MQSKCHFIGIGGIGMSGLARILISQNYEVSGSDMKMSPVTEALTKSGAKVFIGHSKENVEPKMTVVYSSDIKPDNPEYHAAILSQCKLMHRSDLLAKLLHAKKGLAIAGTHGKTTTTSLLIHVLMTAGMDPSFAVGGVLPNLQSNAENGTGQYFIAEADESDGTFLKYQPFGAIVTNIDLDHMNHFITESALIEAFAKFISQVTSKEHLFWCGDDPRLAKLHPPGFSYGFESHCLLRLGQFSQHDWTIKFDLSFQGKEHKDIRVNLTGVHNALNASAVFGLGLSLGISDVVIRQAFATFAGVQRRCEKKGNVNGILFLDDYAHHPTEIEATLKAIRQAIPNGRLIAVFQPHRYTRTKDCLGTFAPIFDSVDQLYITDIYSAGEAEIPGISHLNVLNEVQKSKVSCCYVTRAELSQKLAGILKSHDVIVTLGAGDITRLSSEIIAKINQRD